jgi:hypothetical protein
LKREETKTKPFSYSSNTIINTSINKKMHFWVPSMLPAAMYFKRYPHSK